MLIEGTDFRTQVQRAIVVRSLDSSIESIPFQCYGSRSGTGRNRNNGAGTGRIRNNSTGSGSGSYFLTRKSVKALQIFLQNGPIRF
jgi:hypothetical protein